MASGPGSPAPQDQRVRGYVLHQGGEILPAVSRPVLEPLTQLPRAHAHENHSLVGRRHVPASGDARRNVAPVTGREIGHSVAGGALSARRPAASGTALDVLVVDSALVALQRRVDGRMAVLAPGILEHCLHSLKGGHRIAAGRRDVRGRLLPFRGRMGAAQGDQDERPQEEWGAAKATERAPTSESCRSFRGLRRAARATSAAAVRSGQKRRWPRLRRSARWPVRPPRPSRHRS